MRGCGARHATRTRVPSSAGRRGGGTASAAARRAASCGEMAPCRTSAVSATRRPKHQRRRRRGRPREAHAAAHLRIVPVDAPSKADQPPELRLLAVPCGLVHGLAHRDAHRVRPLGHLRIRGGTRLRCDAREAAACTQSRCACSSPTRPSELGWPRRPWREGESRTLEATTARSRGCRNAWLPRPRAGGVGVRSSWRSRQSGSTRALGYAPPHEGFAELTSIGIDLLEDSELPPTFRFGGMKRFCDLHCL